MAASGLRFAIAIVIASCRGETQHDHPIAASSASAVAALSGSERSAANDAVTSYFTAMATKDCTTLPTLVKGTFTAAECEKEVREFAEHGVQLRSIGKITRDGRQPTAILVTAQLHYEKGDREQIVRVEQDGSAWKVKR
jgi:hypothetical protein